VGLHIEDVSYGRRRVAVRPRNDHPKGVRAKSRFERIVDLHEAATLTAVSDYVMTERPVEASTPFLFLVGGRGAHRLEPLGYPALAKLFARACERAHIRVAWLTPHSLRHTHATRMWEAGMRELTLQKRLGHASPSRLARTREFQTEPSSMTTDEHLALAMPAASRRDSDAPWQSLRLALPRDRAALRRRSSRGTVRRRSTLHLRRISTRTARAGSESMRLVASLVDGPISRSGSLRRSPPA
jgi:hypothetical protein